MFFGSSKKTLSVNEEVLTETKALADRISPLVKTLYSNTAIFFLSKGLSGLMEILCYLLGLAIIAFIFLMDTVFPFHVLKDINTQEVYQHAMQGKSDIQTFTMAVKALVALIGILFIMLGMMIRRSGLRSDMLQKAGRVMKDTETYLRKLQGQMVPEQTAQPQSAPAIDITQIPPQV